MLTADNRDILLAGDKFFLTKALRAKQKLPATSREAFETPGHTPADAPGKQWENGKSKTRSGLPEGRTPSFLDYDLGYFDEEEARVEPGRNPFVPEL